MPSENISLTSYPKLKIGMKLRSNAYFSFCILNCRNSKQDDLSDDLNFSNKHLYMNLPASGPILSAAQGVRARKKGRLVDVVRGEIIIFLRMSSVQMLQRFCEALLESTARRGNQSTEVNRRGWQGCAAKLISQVAHGLDVPEEVVLGGLLIAKRAVDSNLRTSRRFLHRLLLGSLVLAEKCLLDEQNSLENYSLLSGVPIQDLVAIQSYLFTLLEYRILPESQQFESLARGDIDDLFRERRSPNINSATAIE